MRRHPVLSAHSFVLRDIHQAIFDHTAIGPDGGEHPIEYHRARRMPPHLFNLWIDCGRPSASLFEDGALSFKNLYAMLAVIMAFNVSADIPETCAVMWRLHGKMESDCG